MKPRYLDVRLIIGVFIILVMVFGFYGPISNHIYSLNYGYVALGFLALLLIVSVKQAKWYLLVGDGWRLAFKSYFTGQFVNEIAPMGVGDLTKAYVLRNHSKRSFGSALSVPYMERILDISVLSSIAILSSVFLFLATISSYISLVFVLVFALAVGFFLLATFPVKIAGIAKGFLELVKRIVPLKIIGRMVSKLEAFIIETSKDFRAALRAFRKRKAFVSSVLMIAVLDWLLEGVCQVFLLNSMGYEIPILVSVGIVSISWLVSIPSMIPGGLGVREAVLSLLFASWGIPFAAALVSVLIYRGMVFIVFGSGALISLKVDPGQ